MRTVQDTTFLSTRCCCHSTYFGALLWRGLPIIVIKFPPVKSISSNRISVSTASWPRIQCSADSVSMSKVVARIGGYTYPDGSIYLGGWSEKGQRQGFGHLCLPDNSRYVGGFQKGLCSGLGVLIFADGARYEGELMEGWFHGHGVFTRGDGMKYEGEFRGGKLWGWGLVTFRDLTHGFPRQEGFFQDCRLLRNRKCTEVIERAQKVALLARAQAGL